MSASHVHVIDDDMAVLRSIGRLLRSAGYETFLYDGPYALLSATDTLAEGCILLDFRMPEMDGLTLLQELRLRRVDLPVILMTGHADLGTVTEADRLGAADFLEKPFPEERLFRAIDSAMHEMPANNNSGTYDQAIREAAGRIAALSRREREVLLALARGDAQKTIAYDLGISARTVEIHRARMLRRLGVRNLAEAIRLVAIADLGSNTSTGSIDRPFSHSPASAFAPCVDRPVE
jgi:two-component system response regulator FixJ